MAAYVIVQAQVTDWDKFSEYLKESPGTVAQYGGRYVARGGETAVLEGEEQTKRVVLIEFPSLQRAKEWYRSEEYQRIRMLRAGACIGSITAVEGC